MCGYNNLGTITNCYNAGTVNGTQNVGGVCGINDNGTITNCYYLDSEETDSIDGTTFKTTEQFASGEVAYLLSQGENGEIWGQEIGTDPYPVFGGTKVNKLTKTYCDNTTEQGYIYTNSSSYILHKEYNNNGFCTNCGAYQPAVFNETNNCYEISNTGQLYWFAGLVNGTLENVTQNRSANAVITANIVVNTGVLKLDGTLADDTSGFTSWTPIGSSSNYYTGTFDGQNHTISGLYFNNANTSLVGLFGYVGSNGSVSNVGIVDSYFNGCQFVGGVCGANLGTITNCYNTGNVSGSSAIGGVCGANLDTITNCYNTGNVNGSGYFGGVCGSNESGKITGCYNIGAVSSSDGSQYVGGVCGYNFCISAETAEITNCYYDSDKYSGNAVDYNDGTVTDVEGKTTEQFASGEVTYLLNGSTSEGTLAWGQMIGKDDYPVLDSTKKVYYGYTICDESKEKIYSNTEMTDVRPEHNYSNGICTVCRIYEPATKNADGVYEISNAGQLYWFSQQVNSGNRGINAVLTNDIVVNKNVLVNGELNSSLTNPREWTPIGNSSNYYKGTFDGQNHTISGLYFNDSSTSYVGLFGGNWGTIKNVGVVDSYFKGYYYVSGVCGNNNGTMTNCYNTGTVSGTEKEVGGVCACNNGTITNCNNIGAVSGSNNVGGVCGYSSKEITDCYNTGTVSGGESYVGGVCGVNCEKITGCYNTGTVSGRESYVGGVCGDSGGKITGCYNTGAVSGSDGSQYVGGRLQ